MCLNDAVAFPDGSAETPELFSLLHIDVVEITSRICFNSFFDNSALLPLSIICEIADFAAIRLIFSLSLWRLDTMFL